MRTFYAAGVAAIVAFGIGAAIYAPVAGEVSAVNADLADDQSSLASDCYGAGWLFKIKVTGDVSDELMDLAAYEKQLEEEGEPG